MGWGKAELPTAAMGRTTMAGEQSVEMARILVVDDYPETASLIAQLLAREGYQTVSARNAEEALEACRSQDFDLLVSDIHMPGKSGWELLRALLAQRRIPAIAISG